MDDIDRLVAEDTQIKGLKAARAILGGSNVEDAAKVAGIDARTLRKWRASTWWPQIVMMAEAEYRERALGVALRRLLGTMEDEDNPQAYDAAKFVTRLFLVDLPKQRGQAMAGQATAQPTLLESMVADMDPAEALAKLKLLEDKSNG